MEGLHAFYRKQAPDRTRLDFNEKCDSVSFNRVYMTPDGPLGLSQTRVMSTDLNIDSLLHNTSERTIACIIDVPRLIDRKSCELDIKKTSYDLALQHFGLAEYVKYAHSTTTTMDITPRVPDQNMQYFSVYLVHFFGIYTVHDRTKGITLGICWGGSRILQLFMDVLVCLQAQARQQSWIPLVTAVTFNTYHNWRLQATDSFVAQVMKRTGYEGWDMTAHDMADGTLPELSARMSGLATKLAANRRLSSIAQEIISAIERDYDSMITKADEEFNTNVCTVKQRLIVQQIENTLAQATVQNQLTALFNLTNRDETKLSISLAKDSRMIASASKRDSSSMKTLAAVTVIFLPGTLVASVFSMSMFDWQSPARVLSDKFWIYWAVTLPLTVCTVAAWLAWTYRRAVLSRYEDRKAVDSLADTLL